MALMWDSRAWHRWAQERATCHRDVNVCRRRQQRWQAAVSLPVAETRLGCWTDDDDGKYVLVYILTLQYFIAYR